MIQQINLRFPVERVQSDTKAVRMAASVVLLVVVALVGAYAYAMRGVLRTERAIAATQERMERDASLAASLAEDMKGRRNATSLADQVARLQRNLARQRELLTALSSPDLGGADGFSRALEALSAHHVDGVWLNQIVISGTHDLRLAGYATVPGVVPRYIAALNPDEAFAGQTIDVFELARPEGGAGPMRFVLASAALKNAGVQQ